MKQLKNIAFYIVVGALTTQVGIMLESITLFSYLQANIIGLLLTLLAINTATSGLIAAKIQDIVVNHPKINFTQTVKEMKTSLLEQICLVITSVLIVLVYNSKKIEFTNKDFLCNTIFVAVFAYSINILWDTGKAVFIIIEELQKIGEKK